jgi:hypothetical protein
MSKYLTMGKENRHWKDYEKYWQVEGKSAFEAYMRRIQEGEAEGGASLNSRRVL